MPNLSLSALKPYLRSAAFSSFDRLKLQKFCPSVLGGLGVIFMMHRVLPKTSHKAFAPNRYLSITPEFLQSVLEEVEAMGVEIVSLEEAEQRIKLPNQRKFAVFTFDDGFRDVLENAYPVFKKKNLPFTLYIPSAWPEGDGFLYWSLIEEIIAQNETIENTAPDLPKQISCKSLEEKKAAFALLSDYYAQKSDPSKDKDLQALLKKYQKDSQTHCKEHIMSWDQIRQLKQDPLVTIGAHSVNHSDFHLLTDDGLAFELEQSKQKIEYELQKPCLHMAYPFGDKTAIGQREIKAAKKAGYHTATTTRKGVVQPDHKKHMTALPRVHLHGDYQQKGYTAMALSGLPFYILNKFRRHVAD